MLKICMCIMTFCLAPLLRAQDVCYPLNVGDRWQLVQITLPVPPTTSFIDIGIASDTIMPNGQRYVRFSDWVPAFQRQEGSKVLADSVSDTAERILYDFSRSVGDSVGSYTFNSDTFDVILVDSGVRTVFGRPRPTWSFHHYARHLIDANTTQTIADSIGIIHFDGFIGPYELNGAVISGKSYGTIVGVPPGQPSQTPGVHLSQNYPNPFNSETHIRFSIGVTSHVSLEVFDILGRRVGVLTSTVLDAGEYSYVFDAERLSSGTYICRLVLDDSVLSRVMLLSR